MNKLLNDFPSNFYMSDEVAKERSLLTIAIPTYKRHSCLLYQLDQILSEIDWSIIEIIVIDNDPSSELCKKLNQKYPFVHYVKNKYNVGGNENIIRAFEYSRGKYIWVLGDDDPVDPISLKKILSTLNNESPDLLYLKDSTLDKIIHLSSPQDYVQHLNNLGDLIFISTTIIRNDVITSLDGVYFYQTSCAPLLCLILDNLPAKSKIVILHTSLFREVGTSRKSEWNPSVYMTMAISLPLIYSKYKNTKYRSSIKRMLNNNWALNINIAAFLAQYYMYRKREINWKILASNVSYIFVIGIQKNNLFGVLNILGVLFVVGLVFPIIPSLIASMVIGYKIK